MLATGKHAREWWRAWWRGAVLVEVIVLLISAADHLYHREQLAHGMTVSFLIAAAALVFVGGVGSLIAFATDNP